MKKFEELVDYLSMLADKYAFSEKEMNDLQDMIEDIYDGEDEDEDEYINEEPTADQEPVDEWDYQHHHSVTHWNKRLAWITTEKADRHVYFS